MVPCTLVRRSATGSVKDRMIDTWPAMWQTASSPPSNAGSSSGRLPTSPRMKVALLGTFSRLPVDSLSITSTRWPAARIASAKCEPMKPAPPVTSTFMIRTDLRGTAQWRVPSSEAPPRSEDVKLFAPAGNQPGLDHLAALAVGLQQSVQTSFIEAVGLIPGARVGQLSGEKRQQRARAGRHVANRFSDQHLSFRRCEHALDDRGGIRQKMVQARLHYHILPARQWPIFLQIPHHPGSAVGGQSLDKGGIDVQAGITDVFLFQIALKQRGRPAADIQH